MLEDIGVGGNTLSTSVGIVRGSCGCDGVTTFVGVLGVDGTC